MGNFLKRLTAVLLVLFMTVPHFPTFAFALPDVNGIDNNTGSNSAGDSLYAESNVPEEQADIRNSIYMPITIRDFASDGMLFEFMNKQNDDDETYDQTAAYNSITPPTGQIATHSSELLQTHTTQYGGNSAERSHFAIYLPIQSTVAKVVGTNYHDKFSIFGMTAEGRNLDGSYRFEITDATNPWMAVELENYNYTLNDFYGVYIAYKFPDMTDSELKQVRSRVYAGPSAEDNKLTDPYCYYTDFSVQEDDSKSSSYGDYYGYSGSREESDRDTYWDAGVLGKSNEDGYQDYYMAFFPTLQRTGYRGNEDDYDGTSKLKRVRFDPLEPLRDASPNWKGKHVDILYIALLRTDENSDTKSMTVHGAYTTEGKADVNPDKVVINSMQKSLIQHADSTNKYKRGYSIYPTTRVRIRSAAKDNMIGFDMNMNVTKGANDSWTKKYQMLSHDKSTSIVDGQYVFNYDTGYEISGFFYLRYRVSEKYGGAQFSIIDLTEANKTDNDYSYFAHDEPYIADGQWHDIVIPVRINKAGVSSLVTARFVPLSNPEEALFKYTKSGSTYVYSNEARDSIGCVMDFSALRYYTWQEMEALYSDSSTNDETNNKVYTEYAVKEDASKPVKTEVANSNIQWGLFTSSSYSQNGKLYLLSHTDRGAHARFPDDQRKYGKHEIQMPWVGHNMSQAGYTALGEAGTYFVAIRYRTDTAIPSGVTAHFGRNLEIVYSGYYTFDRTFIPVADGKWHTAILNIEDYTNRLGGRHITDVYITFDHEGGKKHIEVAEFSFYRDRRSATYYNNDYGNAAVINGFNGQNGEHFTDMSGFGFVSQGADTDLALPGNAENITGVDEKQLKDGGTSTIGVRQGLVEPSLVNGKLVYTAETILYFAKLIDRYLYIDSNNDGIPNSTDKNYQYYPEDIYGNKMYNSILGDKAYI